MHNLGIGMQLVSDLIGVHRIVHNKASKRRPLLCQSVPPKPGNFRFHKCAFQTSDSLQFFLGRKIRDSDFGMRW